MPVKPIPHSTDVHIPDTLPEVPGDFSIPEGVAYVGPIDLAYYKAGKLIETIRIGSRVTWALIQGVLRLDAIYTQMQEDKVQEKWYESRRVWATILSTLAVILGVFKVSLPEALIANGPDIILAIVSALSGIWSAVLAIRSWFKPKPTG